MTTPALAAAEAPPVVMDPECDLSPLIVAVILQAYYDGRAGDLEAQAWLMGEGQAWIDSVMDVHPDKIRRWVIGGFKPLKQKRKQKQKPHRKPQARFLALSPT